MKYHLNHLCTLILVLTMDTYISSLPIANEPGYNANDYATSAIGKPKYTVRHVIARKNLPSSTSPSIMDSPLSKAAAESSDEESSKSEEIYFSPHGDSKPLSPSPSPSPSPSSAAASSTAHSDGNVRSYSSESVENQTNTIPTSLPLHNANVVADSSEPPFQNKIIRDLANAKVETVVINAETNSVKLDKTEGTGSNLWIYSNVICILLVVVVSIFLIFHPKRDCRTACADSSQPPSESSTSSCNAPPVPTTA